MLNTLTLGNAEDAKCWCYISFIVLRSSIYTRQNKKRTTTIFPIKFSFRYENVSCLEIFITNQILLKRVCDVDEYQYLP